MMSMSAVLLTANEAMVAGDAFLCTLYGHDIFRRWREVRHRQRFDSERHFVTWLLDVADHYQWDTDATAMPGIATVQLHGMKVETPSSASNLISPTAAVNVGEDVNAAAACQASPSAALPHTISYTHSEGSLWDEDDDDHVEDLHVNIPPHPLQSDQQGEKLVTTIDHERRIILGPVRAVPRRKKSEGPQTFQCSLCHYKCNANWLLNRHYRGTHDTEKAHRCDKCKFRTSTSLLLRYHQINKHQAPSMYICDKCVRPMPTPSLLKEHAKKCKGIRAITDGSTAGRSNKKYLCDLCAFATDYKNSLENHVKHYHEKIKAFKCPHCPYQGSLKVNLKVHLIYKHKYESRYKCHVCDISFPSQVKLEEHQNRPKCTRAAARLALSSDMLDVKQQVTADAALSSQPLPSPAAGATNTSTSPGEDNSAGHHQSKEDIDYEPGDSVRPTTAPTEIPVNNQYCSNEPD